MIRVTSSPRPLSRDEADDGVPGRHWHAVRRKASISLAQPERFLCKALLAFLVYESSQNFSSIQCTEGASRPGLAGLPPTPVETSRMGGETAPLVCGKAQTSLPNRTGKCDRPARSTPARISRRPLEDGAVAPHTRPVSSGMRPALAMLRRRKHQRLPYNIPSTPRLRTSEARGPLGGNTGNELFPRHRLTQNMHVDFWRG